jgi:PAS domain S-box-containing protein
LDEIAIVIADTTGVIHFWSKGAERAFGHAAEKAVGQTLDLIVPAEFREAHWRGFYRAMAAGSAAAEGLANEFPVLGAGGGIRATPGKLALLRAEGDRVIGAMVIFE